MTKYFGLLLTILLTGCSFTNTAKAQQLHEKESPQLISWSSSFVKERNLEDFTYYDDHENFIREYFSVDYSDKQIIATTLIEVNCSDSIQGKIDVSNDTIYLKSDII